MPVCAQYPVSAVLVTDLIPDISVSSHRRRCLLAVVISLLFFTALAVAAPVDYVPGELLVRYQDNNIAAAVARSLPGNKGVERIARGIARVHLAPGQSMAQAKQALLAQPQIRYVQPNYIKRIQLIPDDTNFDTQWGFDNQGQPVPGTTVTGTPNADVNAPEAWDITTGNAAVVVALIDTGIQLSHPEFAGRVWQNPDESPNGIDDDHNGFIDDTQGWDFVSTVISPTGDNIPEDGNGHGTHMAGLIAARANNGSQIAGLNWNLSLMVLRAFDSQGLGDTVSSVKAVDYAVANGARIINASFGAPGDICQDINAPDCDRMEFEAYQRARDQGVLVVTAACNGANSVGFDNDNPLLSQQPCVPASYNLDNIIAVASTDENDRLAPFSNWGAVSVDLAAPGTDIATTAWGDQRPNFADVVSGTSISTAFVSGAAALLLARGTALGGNLSAQDLRRLLLTNTDSVPDLQGRVATGGRLNIAKALNAIEVSTVSKAPSGGGGGGGGGAWSLDIILMLLWRLWRDRNACYSLLARRT